MKKLLSVCAVVLMCVLLLGITVSAEETEMVKVEFDRWSRVVEPSDQAVLQGGNMQQCLEALYLAILDQKSEINISSYGIPVGQVNDLAYAFYDLMDFYPELFYVSNISYTYSPSTGCLIKIYINYSMTGTQLQEAQDFYHATLNSILEQMDENWSDPEKILFINDYLAAHYCYDMRLYSDPSSTNHNAYTFFRDGTGVCEAYYLACKALLDACGIPSTYGQSNRANHIWNVVQLDGNWYHLDVTWNDPVTDLIGRANHDYFLVSTERLLTMDPNRSDWICGTSVSCSSTIYDDYYWAGVSSPFVPIDGKWYYCSKQGICVTEDVRVVGTKKIDMGKWTVPNGGGSYWSGAYSGLSAYRGWLIYNTEDTVVAYNPRTLDSHVLYTLENSGKRIFGTTVKDRKLHMEIDVQMWCDTGAYPGGRCPENEEVSVSMTYLDELRAKTYGGVTVQDDHGVVTVSGTPDAAKPFCVIAAAYTPDGKLCDMKMIRSTEMNGTQIRWQLEGKTVRIFMLAGNTYTPVG